MRREVETGLSGDVPIVLSQWYDTAKWILEKIDKFPKNQRFIFGQRLADRSLCVLEILVEAAYGTRKAHLLAEANRQIEVLRWLLRLAMDRKLLTVRQFGFACKGLTECGRMVGGWLKQAAAPFRDRVVHHAIVRVTEPIVERRFIEDGVKHNSSVDRARLRK